MTAARIILTVAFAKIESREMLSKKDSNYTVINILVTFVQSEKGNDNNECYSLTGDRIILTVVSEQ